MQYEIIINSEAISTKNKIYFPKRLSYEGDPRSNANTSVISSTFGMSKNGLHIYYDILPIL